MKMKMTPRAATVLAALAGAFALSGCVGAIRSDAPSQLDELGKVRITTELCLGLEAGGGVFRQDAAPGTCQEYDGFGPIAGLDAGDIRAAGAEVRARTGARPGHVDVVESLIGGLSISQVLIAYRVPEGAVAPETITGEVELDEDFARDVNLLSEAVLWPLAWSPAHPPSPAPALPVADDPATPSDESKPGRPLSVPSRISFRRDTSYDAELARLAPAPRGERWVGYVSEQVPMLLTGDLTVNADFGLPDGANGAPYAGPFPHVTNVGLRVSTTREDVESLALALDVFGDALQSLEWGLLDALATVLDEDAEWSGLPIGDVIATARGGEPGTPAELFAALDPERPVVCDDRDGEIQASDAVFGLPTTLCQLEPADDVVVDETLATRDLVVTGGSVSVQQGQTAQVPFTLDYAGPAVTRPLSLVAEARLPYGGATIGVGDWSPGAGEDAIRVVPVSVPEDTRPGVYDVVLRAGLPAALAAGDADATRAGVAKLTVTAKPVPAPAPQQLPPTLVIEHTETSLARPLERLYAARRGTIAFGYVCPKRLGWSCRTATARLLLDRRLLNRRKAARAAKRKLVRVGTVSFKAKPGRRVRVTMPISRSVRTALLARGWRLKARLVITAGDHTQRRDVLLRRG